LFWLYVRMILVLIAWHKHIYWYWHITWNSSTEISCLSMFSFILCIFIIFYLCMIGHQHVWMMLPLLICVAKPILIFLRPYSSVDSPRLLLPDSSFVITVVVYSAFRFRPWAS
jgi:hypothetical protein